MRSKLAFAMLAAALVAGGCTTVPSVPEDHFYRLVDVTPPAPSGHTRALDGVLAVGTIDGAGLYRERAIVYTEPGRPTELLRYHYHAWIDGPPRLIQDQLQAYLRRSGVAPLVIEDDARTQWDYLLSGRLRRFERVTERGGGSRVAVALDLQLDRRGASRPLLVREYHASFPVKGRTVGNAVDAFSVALQDIYNRLSADLASLPREPARH